MSAQLNTVPRRAVATAWLCVAVVFSLFACAMFLARSGIERGWSSTTVSAIVACSGAIYVGAMWILSRMVLPGWMSVLRRRVLWCAVLASSGFAAAETLVAGRNEVLGRVMLGGAIGTAIFSSFLGLRRREHVP